MKKRTITVPIDHDAIVDLDFDRADGTQLLACELSDTDFLSLENAGFFSSINRLVGCNIDDFEDEAISAKEDIEKVLAFFDSLTVGYKPVAILVRIKELFQEALIRQTGVYFFF